MLTWLLLGRSFITPVILHSLKKCSKCNVWPRGFSLPKYFFAIFSVMTIELGSLSADFGITRNKWKGKNAKNGGVRTDNIFSVFLYLRLTQERLQAKGKVAPTLLSQEKIPLTRGRSVVLSSLHHFRSLRLFHEHLPKRFLSFFS